MIVLDTPYESEGLTEVHTAREIRDLFNVTRVQTPTGAREFAERARRAKMLVDEIRSVAEKRRFELAGDPWGSREPLVSVRIATWKGHQVLVERTIPSVLTGSYRNVEVVVCSDGPDPDARRAVQGIGDPRVRYVELTQRPIYPEQPWSFWETAGIHAVHHALDHARGSFVAPLDHDDAFTEDHIETLLAAAAANQADLVYGQALMQDATGRWSTCGSAPSSTD